MEKAQKTFAFKLSTQEDAKKTDANDGKWQARDGVAVAGCTDPRDIGAYRYGSRWNSDGGVWC